MLKRLLSCLQPPKHDDHEFIQCEPVPKAGSQLNSGCSGSLPGCSPGSPFPELQQPERNSSNAEHSQCARDGDQGTADQVPKQLEKELYPEGLGCRSSTASAASRFSLSIDVELTPWAAQGSRPHPGGTTSALAMALLAHGARSGYSSARPPEASTVQWHQQQRYDSLNAGYLEVSSSSSSCCCCHVCCAGSFPWSCAGCLPYLRAMHKLAFQLPTHTPLFHACRTLPSSGLQPAACTLRQRSSACRLRATCSSHPSGPVSPWWEATACPCCCFAWALVPLLLGLCVGGGWGEWHCTWHASVLLV